MTVYVAEDFEPHEADVLRRYFTNLDGPVFALVNLPEVVKGALFARYSRSPKARDRHSKRWTRSNRGSKAAEARSGDKTRRVRFEECQGGVVSGGRTGRTPFA